MIFNWIKNKYFDSIFILLPHFIGLVLLVIFYPFFIKYNIETPAIYWLILIVGIDVTHVYSTLFRTYFDKTAWQKNSNTLILIPFISLIIGVFIHYINADLFWRILAYIAVFHFIKQQYGFLKIYIRDTHQPIWSDKIDIISIYAFTLLPILIWHFSGNKNFNWFVENDFFYFKNNFIKNFLTVLNICLFVFYLSKEIYQYHKYKLFVIPKFSLLVGTAFSWFIGIVWLNGDLAFTTLNVVAHGIPYIALIWFYGEKNYLNSIKENKFLQFIFSYKGIVFFIFLLILFAFLEEAFWDNLVWREHQAYFSFFSFLPVLNEHALIHLIIPLLSLPQITHYILDGYIWRNKNKSIIWK